jgi:DNA-binding MarR family transcriptional regulator
VTLSEDQRDVAAQALDEVIRFVVRQMMSVREVGFSALAALGSLDSSGPSRITELAVHEGISQPSMTAMVSRLERQGLVERRRDPSDGRIVLVAITDAGREILRRRHAGRVAFMSSLIGALPGGEQGALLAAAPALRNLVDQAAVPTALAAAREAIANEDYGE